MNSRLKRWILAAGLALPGPTLSQVNPPPPVSLDSLLPEMTELSRLARQAPAGTRLVQFSSYDRNSRIEAGEKKEWFANRDLGHYLRKEATARGTEWVMAEVEGPGAIVRMWSANAGQRLWRVYLDGQEGPAMEAVGQDLFNGLNGALPEVFSGRRNFGYNLYLPIPFQTGCKVTVALPDGKDREPAPLMYYQVDIRTFPPGTRVETFSREKLSAARERLNALSRRLAQPQTDLPGEIKTIGGQAQLAAGDSVRLKLPEGPAAIYELTIRVAPQQTKALKEVLGQTLLEISFDASEPPQVQSPLGEFFGAGPGLVPFHSLPLSMEQPTDAGRMVSRWVMPYQQMAEIRLRNFSDQAADYEIAVAVAGWEWGEDSLYFHAGYRSWQQLRTRPESDLTLLAAEGPGRYVGTALQVRNHLAHFWWGEGDEKIYLDGESFPSIFGTGTEDFFGYAWCVQYFRFAHAYHGVPRPSRVWLAIPQATSLLGLFPWGWVLWDKIIPVPDISSQYRWQILDDLPFEKSIQFDLELLHHQKTAVDMSAVSYWYAAPGAGDDVPAVELSGREIW